MKILLSLLLLVAAPHACLAIDKAEFSEAKAEAHQALIEFSTATSAIDFDAWGTDAKVYKDLREHVITEAIKVDSKLSLINPSGKTSSSDMLAVLEALVDVVDSSHFIFYGMTEYDRPDAPRGVVLDEAHKANLAELRIRVVLEKMLAEDASNCLRIAH